MGIFEYEANTFNKVEVHFVQEEKEIIKSLISFPSRLKTPHPRNNISCISIYTSLKRKGSIPAYCLSIRGLKMKEDI